MEDQEGRFIFIPHTADAQFKAFGKTIEECFSNAAVATFEIITETNKIRPKQEFHIELSAKSKEALLFDFIDEILFLLDTEGFVLGSCEEMTVSHDESQKKDSWKLSCTVKGDYHKSYDVSCNVKAVTYNEMYLKQTPQGWECQVVVDL